MDKELTLEDLTGEKYKTGGELNKIAEKYNSVSPKSTVPIIKLYDYHNPKSYKECVDLISSHTEKGSDSDCPCGCRSKGSLKDFAMKLWEKVQKEQEVKSAATTNSKLFSFSFQDCMDFIIGLFVKNSLIGLSMEQKLIDKLNKNDKGKTFVRADANLDGKYSVDILMYENGELKKGVQVKPTSYDRTPNEIKIRNEKNNTAFKEDFKLDHDVTYVYYDFKTLKFTNPKYN
jgi:hypothetical protein